MADREPNAYRFYQNDVVAGRLKVDGELVNQLEHAPDADYPRDSERAYEQYIPHLFDLIVRIKDAEDEVQGQHAEEVDDKALVHVVLQDIPQAKRRLALHDDRSSQLTGNEDRLETYGDRLNGNFSSLHAIVEGDNEWDRESDVEAVDELN